MSIFETPEDPQAPQVSPEEVLRTLRWASDLNGTVAPAQTDILKRTFMLLTGCHVIMTLDMEQKSVLYAPGGRLEGVSIGVEWSVAKQRLETATHTVLGKSWTVKFGEVDEQRKSKRSLDRRRVRRLRKIRKRRKAASKP